MLGSPNSPSALHAGLSYHAYLALCAFVHAQFYMAAKLEDSGFQGQFSYWTNYDEDTSYSAVTHVMVYAGCTVVSAVILGVFYATYSVIYAHYRIILAKDKPAGKTVCQV